MKCLKTNQPTNRLFSVSISLYMLYSRIYHHHHHVVLVARISLTLSRHSSLSFIASGRSSGQHPVSSHSCWMYVRAGRPAFARLCMGVHNNTSLMSSSLLLQQCPACLVRLTWIVFVIGGRWPYSWCLVGCCRQDLFKIARSIFVYIYIYKYMRNIIKRNDELQLTNEHTSLKKYNLSHFILERVDVGCVWKMCWRQWTDCYIDPSSTSFSSWLGCSTVGHWRPQALSLQADSHSGILSSTDSN